MLFPTDPRKREGLWESFSERAEAGALLFVVHDGRPLSEVDPSALLAGDVRQLVGAFESADLVRFGSARGQAIGPFFAFTLDGSTARLKEYAIDKEAADDFQESMQSVAIAIFFERKDIQEIVIPFALQSWNVQDWLLTSRSGEAVLLRKS